MEIIKRNFSSDKIKEDYSKVAWFYDFWSILTETKAAEKTLEFAEIKNGWKILEVAVGTGRLFEKIVKINTDGFNEGLDYSQDMLEKALKKISGRNYHNYRLREGSAYDLDFADDNFDLLINNFMMDLLPENDFVKILTGYYRVLKPGGKLVISTMTTGEKLNDRFWFYVAKHFPGLMTGCRPIDLKEYLKESGFKNVQSQYISQNTFPSEVIKAEKIIN